MNKFLVVIIALLFTIAFIGWFIPLSDSVSSDKLITAGEDLGIIMMLVNGTFISSRVFSAAKFFIGVIILGAAFKILHLTGGDQLLICSFAGLLFVYFIHFLGKKSKSALDYLKVILLLSFSIMPPLVMSHLISTETTNALTIISHVLFIITFGLFLFQGYKNNFAADK